ncbi:alpha/beta hydrolase [Methylobrevis albus]|uniref:Dienelactone hydrolase family protein n=1 Tax=Methylobrevis albus TaxID=2793297 RepID=A0A931MXQ6_9HYPH|nr:dienelactone hydrolase family protein [Methylobrevis albus]MBH0237235.1 dienelactone hydrolase family protein [Methylobrevis albus]
MSVIDGPRLAPVSGRPATSLVVFLHGYGADGRDLIDIGRSWAPELPDCAFVSPHAPEPCGMAPTGRQWFPLTLRDPTEYWRGAVHAAPALHGFLDAERARLQIAENRIVLVGFSQGTMMALHVGLRRPSAPGAIIGYSGKLAGPEHLGEVKVKPPITLIHGDRDEVLPIDLLFEATDALGAADIPVSFHISPGVGHGIDQRGLLLGLAAVREALG